ncbi:ATPase, partial [Rhizobium phaseoli]
QRPGELDQTILSQCSTLFAMRLANDRDQEIIRSAIPNSSISTTSFISSIGNGEAIAFGEAISVPMRMRFSRVEENLLPKAASANSKHSEEDPDTVDLRKIVTRMRAVTVAPDISNFQQSFGASTAGSDEENDADEHLEAKPYAPPPPASPPPASAPLESYRRELLPQTPRLDPAAPPSVDPRLDALRREMRREEPIFPRPAPQADQPAITRREPGASLRESILKKPLSSLYNKD